MCASKLKMKMDENGKERECLKEKIIQIFNTKNIENTFKIHLLAARTKARIIYISVRLDYFSIH